MSNQGTYQRDVEAVLAKKRRTEREEALLAVQPALTGKTWRARMRERKEQRLKRKADEEEKEIRRRAMRNAMTPADRALYDNAEEVRRATERESEELLKHNERNAPIRSRQIAKLRGVFDHGVLCGDENCEIVFGATAEYEVIDDDHVAKKRAPIPANETKKQKLRRLKQEKARKEALAQRGLSVKSLLRMTRDVVYGDGKVPRADVDVDVVLAKDTYRGRFVESVPPELKITLPSVPGTSWHTHGDNESLQRVSTDVTLVDERLRKHRRLLCRHPGDA
jgi:hypothetical protein